MQLGELLNYSKSWVSNLENEKASLAPDELFRLSGVLGVTPDVLTGEDRAILDRFDMIDRNIHSFGKPKNELVRLVEELITEVDVRYGPRDQFRARLQRGNIEYFAGNYDFASEFYKEAEAIAIDAQDRIARHKARVNIVYCHLVQMNFDEAEAIIKQDLGEIDDLFCRRKSVYTLAKLYYKQERLTKAEKTLSPVMSLDAETIPEKQLKIDCDITMGYICLYTDRDEDALFYAKRALNAIRELGDVFLEPYALQILGEVVLNKGDRSGGLAFFSDAYLKTKHKLCSDAKELEFLMACCSDDRRSYEEMKSILVEIEQGYPEHRFVSRIYERMAKKAHELGYADEMYQYSHKAIQSARIAIG